MMQTVHLSCTAAISALGTSVKDNQLLK